MLRSSLRTRLITVLALALLPAAALAIAESIRTYNNATLLADRSLIGDAVLEADEEKAALLEARRSIRTISLLPGIMESVPDQCGDILGRIHLESPIYSRLMVVRQDGIPVCAFPELPPGTSFARSPLLAAMNARPDFIVSSQIESTVDGEQLVAMLTPVFSPVGEHIGHVTAAINVERLEGLLNADEKLPGTFTALVNANGHVIARKRVESAANVPSPEPGIVRQHLFPGVNFFETEAADGEILHFATAPVLGNDVFLLIGTDNNSLRSGFEWGLFIAIAAPLAMYILALAVAWYAVDRLVLRHIDRLRRIVGLVERGRSSARVTLEANAPQELQELADRVDDMLDSLDERGQELESALAEQRLLTKEVYHRVKNNLQIISSLMNLQVRNVDSGGARGPLLAAQKRIQAMSSVHEQLYRETGMSSVRLDMLIDDLSRSVRSGMGEAAEQSSVRLDIEPLAIDPDQAIPLALLVTEALANALSHAAEAGAAETIDVVLDQPSPDRLRLAIINRLARETAFEPPGSKLGLQLIRVLARQLRGELTIVEDDRYRLELVFPYSPPESEEAADAA